MREPEFRELKFRAWHKILKNYAHIKRIWLDGDGNGHDEIFAVSDVETTYPIHEVVLEEYTGLKDKNGKEIYEGDIVEASIDGAWATGKNSVSFGKVKWKLEVIYNDIRFMDVLKVIGSKNAPDRIYYLFDKELSELEVIGNIHENRELLEQEDAKG